MKIYLTEQRQILTSFLKSNRNKQFSIDEIAKHLCSKNSLSISSIYRNINIMVGDGLVARFQKEGCRKFLYQYIGDNDCANHLHLKCETCGEILHLEDDSMNKMISQMLEANDFIINKKKTILYGMCKSCSE